MLITEERQVAVVQTWALNAYETSVRGVEGVKEIGVTRRQEQTMPLLGRDFHRQEMLALHAIRAAPQLKGSYEDCEGSEDDGAPLVLAFVHDSDMLKLNEDHARAQTDGPRANDNPTFGEVLDQLELKILGCADNIERWGVFRRQSWDRGSLQRIPDALRSGRRARGEHMVLRLTILSPSELLVMRSDDLELARLLLPALNHLYGEEFGLKLGQGCVDGEEMARLVVNEVGRILCAFVFVLVVVCFASFNVKE